MTYAVRATNSMGAIGSSRETAVEAYALATQYQESGFDNIVIKTGDGTEYGVAEFYQALSMGRPV